MKRVLASPISSIVGIRPTPQLLHNRFFRKTAEENDVLAITLTPLYCTRTYCRGEISLYT